MSVSINIFEDVLIWLKPNSSLTISFLTIIFLDTSQASIFKTETSTILEISVRKNIFNYKYLLFFQNCNLERVNNNIMDTSIIFIMNYNGTIILTSILFISNSDSQIIFSIDGDISIDDMKIVLFNKTMAEENFQLFCFIKGNVNFQNLVLW